MSIDPLVRRHPTLLAVLSYQPQLEGAQMTMTDVANHIGVSTEWVRQLCIKLGIHPKQPRKTGCKGCGVRIEHTVNESGYRTHRIYCSEACKEKHRPRLARQCDECREWYVLEGRARTQYLANKVPRLRRTAKWAKVYGITTSRCPQCKEWARGFRDILTVPCTDCGVELQRKRYTVLRAQRNGRTLCCQSCASGRVAEGYRRALALRGGRHRRIA